MKSAVIPRLNLLPVSTSAPRDIVLNREGLKQGLRGMRVHLLVQPNPSKFLCLLAVENSVVQYVYLYVVLSNI